MRIALKPHPVSYTHLNQKPDRKPEFESEQQKAVYWIKHFLEKGDMSANEIYCRLDNEGVSKRVARMVKTEKMCIRDRGLCRRNPHTGRFSELQRTVQQAD